MALQSRPSDVTPPAQRPAAAGFDRIMRFWDRRLQHWCAKLHPGEYYVTRNDEAVCTTLGSCIGACLRDVATGVGGMNHFMLPKDQSTAEDPWNSGDGTPSTRYGAYAMESLINETLKLGARRERLELKLFGGGQILPSLGDIGPRNIEFARGFAMLEKLQVAAEDLGGTTPRNVIYFPATGRVLVKRLPPIESSEIAASEVLYRQRLAERSADADDVELFG